MADPDRLPCAFCRQVVAPPLARPCPRCAALYHPDCWTANGGRCAVYACEPPPPKPDETGRELNFDGALRIARSPWLAAMLLGLVWFGFRAMTGEAGAARSTLHRRSPSGVEAGDVPRLLIEAQTLAAQAFPLLRRIRILDALPRDPAERTLLRAEIGQALETLGRAHSIYLRCRWADPTDESERGLATGAEQIMTLERLAADLADAPR